MDGKTTEIIEFIKVLPSIRGLFNGSMEIGDLAFSIAEYTENNRCKFQDNKEANLKLLNISLNKQVPKKGSNIQVLHNKERTECYLMGVIGKVERIELNAGENDFGGLIVIAEFTAKINELVTTVNAIKEALADHTHTIPAGIPVSTTGTPAAQTGASTSPVMVPAPTVNIDNAPVLVKEDFENQQIKHYG